MTNLPQRPRGANYALARWGPPQGSTVAGHPARRCPLQSWAPPTDAEPDTPDVSHGTIRRPALGLSAGLVTVLSGAECVSIAERRN
jgi:hypothetical protein